MRQKKDRSSIDWFISMPAKMSSSGYQSELKLDEEHFYKADREELDMLIEAA